MNNIKELEAELAAFLVKHSHLQPLQDHLNERMSTMTPVERMQYLADMMDKSLAAIIAEKEKL